MELEAVNHEGPLVGKLQKLQQKQMSLIIRLMVREAKTAREIKLRNCQKLVHLQRSLL